MYHSSFQVCFLVLSAVTLCLSGPTYYNKNLEEAEQIALESTGFIVPIDTVVRKIMRDLKSIRAEYPEIVKVVHRRKWIPGEVLARGITEQQINAIDDSQLFGHLANVKTYRFGSVLTFNKAYNPERLSERLNEKFGIRAEPNTSTGDASKATGYISYDPSKLTYTIEKGPSGYSYPGYSNKSSWKFSVDKNGSVKLKDSTKPGFIYTKKY